MLIDIFPTVILPSHKFHHFFPQIPNRIRGVNDIDMKSVLFERTFLFSPVIGQEQRRIDSLDDNLAHELLVVNDPFNYLRLFLEFFHFEHEGRLLRVVVELL
jgi:hypothetical protein